MAEGPAWAVLDGDSALGMVTSVFAMTTAIGKARQAGVGYVGVRNSSHFGAAGDYASLAARAGFIGLAMANDIPSVAAPGSRTAVTGSNPLAYAVPAGKHPPLMLDMSIATVAGGKVYAARERGEPIPATWLIGEDGLPTDDPASYPERSVLTPAAAHKGFGLALLIESLAGCLSGAAATWQIRSWLRDDPALPTGHGAAFLAPGCTGSRFPPTCSPACGSRPGWPAWTSAATSRRLPMAPLSVTIWHMISEVLLSQVSCAKLSARPGMQRMPR